MKRIQLKKLIREMVKEESSAYKAFFNAAMKKFGVSSPDEFESEKKKKEFFDYVDKHWNAKKETD